MKHSKKGQSITEFLIVYGWSLLVILIISVLIFSIFVDINSLISNSVELNSNFIVDPGQSLASEDDFVLIVFEYIGIDKISISPNNKSIISNIKKSDIFSNCHLTWIKNINTNQSSFGNSQGNIISQGSSISSEVIFLNSHTGVMGFNCINIDLLKGDVLSGDITLISKSSKTGVDFKNQGDLVFVITETKNNLINNLKQNITNTSKLNCNVNSIVVGDLTSQLFYNASSQPLEVGCSEILRTCNDGFLSGDDSFIYQSCVEYNSSFNCFDSSNVGKIGMGKECAEMLIVDDLLLHSVASSVVGGDESFQIEFEEKNYTFKDSQYNIFTGQVEDMSQLFRSTSFNSNINYWDVSSVTNMNGMFSYTSFFNQPLNEWDVSSVTNMSGMFYNANSFNQPLNEWDVSSVIDLSGMFLNANSFNQPLDNWDISLVTNLAGLFFGADLFNQPLNNWNVSLVVDMSGLFYDANSFNQPLDKWNVSSVFNMEYMFYNASSFNQNISCWNVEIINSEPLEFNTDSMFEENFSMQPRWGTIGC